MVIEVCFLWHYSNSRGRKQGKDKKELKPRDCYLVKAVEFLWIQKKQSRKEYVENAFDGKLPIGSRFCNHEEKNFATTRRKKIDPFFGGCVLPPQDYPCSVKRGGQVVQDIPKGFIFLIFPVRARTTRFRAMVLISVRAMSGLTEAWPLPSLRPKLGPQWGSPSVFTGARFWSRDSSRDTHLVTRNKLSSL